MSCCCLNKHLAEFIWLNHTCPATCGAFVVSVRLMQGSPKETALLIRPGAVPLVRTVKIWRLVWALLQTLFDDAFACALARTLLYATGYLKGEMVLEQAVGHKHVCRCCYRGPVTKKSCPAPMMALSQIASGHVLSWQQVKCSGSRNLLITRTVCRRGLSRSSRSGSGLRTIRRPCWWTETSMGSATCLPTWVTCAQPLLNLH